MKSSFVPESGGFIKDYYKSKNTAYQEIQAGGALGR